jgi:hypothetical protein
MEALDQVAGGHQCRYTSLDARDASNRDVRPSQLPATASPSGSAKMRRHAAWFEDKLIPLKLWQRDQGRFICDLNLPASSEKYLQRSKRD